MIFRLLLGGGTIVQLPLAKYEIHLYFSKSYSRHKLKALYMQIYFLTFIIFFGILLVLAVLMI